MRDRYVSAFYPTKMKLPLLSLVPSVPTSSLQLNLNPGESFPSEEGVKITETVTSPVDSARGKDELGLRSRRPSLSAEIQKVRNYFFSAWTKVLQWHHLCKGKVPKDVLVCRDIAEYSVSSTLLIIHFRKDWELGSDLHSPGTACQTNAAEIKSPADPVLCSFRKNPNALVGPSSLAVNNHS